MEHRLEGSQGATVGAPGLQSTGSVVMAHGISCPEACGIFLEQESNPCLLHCQVDSFPLGYQGGPCNMFFLFSVLSSIALYEQVAVYHSHAD